MWQNIPRPIVFAHRGASGHAPENTMPAFELAYNVGARAIEFDVKLSKDGQVVIIHDQTLDRTTDGQGDIRHFSLAELKKYKANKTHPGSYSEVRIPTLDELFSSLGGKLCMNVELTNYATPFDNLVPKVVELVKKYQMEERILFSSFYVRNLKTAKVLLPEVPCGLLAWPGSLGIPNRFFGLHERMYTATHPYLRDTTAGYVNRAHANGKRVHVWTVNDLKQIRDLVGLGVDGFFTDEPELALKQLGLNR